jgi:hypothetical protein
MTAGRRTASMADEGCGGSSRLLSDGFLPDQTRTLEPLDVDVLDESHVDDAEAALGTAWVVHIAQGVDDRDVSPFVTGEP